MNFVLKQLFIFIFIHINKQFTRTNNKHHDKNTKVCQIHMISSYVIMPNVKVWLINY